MHGNELLMKEEIQQLIANKCVLALMGPTASGKSRLSLALAECLPIEIISVDSALIYRGMDIGSAKPTAEERAKVSHHLIDILDPEQSYSASEFVDDVHRLVKAIFARGKLPVLVGGTMMYFNALQKGMADLPEADEMIRQKWLDIWKTTPEILHQRLEEVDPVAAARIHPNDSQRLVRALEVFELTGKALSEHQAEGQGAGLTEFNLIKIGLVAEERAKVHQQIAKRFDQMLEEGFLKEVEGLMINPKLHLDLPSMRSVGYRQAWLFLQGENDFDTFKEKSLAATRQLAKRQLTWLRKENELITLDPFILSLPQQLSKVIQVYRAVIK